MVLAGAALVTGAVPLAIAATIAGGAAVAVDGFECLVNHGGSMPCIGMTLGLVETFGIAGLALGAAGEGVAAFPLRLASQVRLPMQ